MTRGRDSAAASRGRRRKAPASKRQSWRSCLILGTRGIKARHRHLLRDLLRLLPHAEQGSKVDPEDGLGAVLKLCEDRLCGSTILLDARDPHRLYTWAASCPDGPSAMFRVLNIHTIEELKLEARRASGARNVLVFDREFEHSAARRVLRELLTAVFAVPHEPDARPAQHALSFAWLDGRIWMRVYRISYDEAGGVESMAEIGPRLVLKPMRIISGGFGGTVLQNTFPR